MPALYPELWRTRVAKLLSFTDSAPWLDDIEEIDTEVIEMGSGSASEQNLIHIPLENFDVEVLLNNSSYPLAEQAFTDDEAVVKLDKWETKVTTLSDDQVMGASYKRIDNITRPHTRALLENKFTKAIHALAHAAKMSKVDRRLVLSSDHWNDLLLDRDRFANQLNNIAKGEVAPKIAGFKIYQYDTNPYFHDDTSTLTKTAYSAVITPRTDFQT